MDIENFKMNPSIRFEYKYLSSENPTVYLDHAKDTEVVEEAPVELEKEAEMAKDTGAAAWILRRCRPSG